MYIKRLQENYPVQYILHKKNKAHGLAGMNKDDFDIPNDISLFIVPDSGTNDWEQCNWLIDHGCDVICLDHHEPSEDAIKNKAIIVNNQMSGQYSDKSFSGVGIAYEFLRALDDYYIAGFADDYFDLVSFGNISDVMDIRNCQTRYYIEQGINNINNKFLIALNKAQEFSTKGIVNVHNISWFWTPILNAMLRIGELEDRDLLFRAFIETDEVFEYKKRDGEIVDESIYDRAARLCKNIKSRQDKMRDQLFEELKEKINQNDKISLIVVENSNSGIIGLSAMKICDTTKKPTIIVREFERDGKLIYGGSARNYNGSPVKDFKELVSSTGEFIFANGHSGAFGVELSPNNIESARIALNKAAENIVFDPTIYVDFIININDIEYQFIKTIDDSKWLYGTGIEEPIIAIEGVEVCPADIAIMGKDKNAISFQSNGIKFCAFKLSCDDALLNLAQDADEDIVRLEVVGSCGLNEYQGRVTSQFIISDYNICL